MIKIQRADERGHFEHGWLDTYHSFSFADYHDPDHMGFRVLRVINEDVIAPGQGFGTHGHRDMEIVTWVLSGANSYSGSTTIDGGTLMLNGNAALGDSPMVALNEGMLVFSNAAATSDLDQPFWPASSTTHCAPDWKVLLSTQHQRLALAKATKAFCTSQPVVFASTQNACSS